MTLQSKNVHICSTLLPKHHDNVSKYNSTSRKQRNQAQHNKPVQSGNNGHAESTLQMLNTLVAYN